ncbi:MAG: PhnD/SsuA/transferrin family substrate-binding protein [Sphingobium sp.]
MIAALPMYDLPWLRAANDGLWKKLAQGLRARGVAAVPDGLDRDGDLETIWLSPGLLLGQTCGYPLMTRLQDKVRLVATPHYEAEGCEGPTHCSAILVRRDSPARSLGDLRGARAGVNSWTSNSGMNLFRAAIAPLAGGLHFFGSVHVTRSHARSVAAILSGRIDVAAIDAVTLTLLRDRYRCRLDALRVLDWTPPSPGLPLITARQTSHTIIHALQEELSHLSDQAALPTALRVVRFSTLRVEDYRPILALEKQAIAAGYPVIA